jgi:hypothetical protein
MILLKGRMAYALLSLSAGTGTIRGRKPCTPTGILLWNQFKRKKGDETDYVKRQYIGNLGKIENGIVAVTAYGGYKLTTFCFLLPRVTEERYAAF